jgi:hypothetical protein
MSAKKYVKEISPRVYLLFLLFFDSRSFSAIVKTEYNSWLLLCIFSRIQTGRKGRFAGGGKVHTGVGIA